ncbi:Multidrug resistance protein MdtA precursor [Planctomycetes bacterium Poly30]|uniref:Multidrug resistance protein MdtA n=1 Tax=Saltatorellus ferox TaxID=2528018 RepID=A0A518EZK9_9BACT|nr:Multidrug resistance protein MdtA precursor [Planctomycetes bacterium Poly30]
MTKKRRLPAWLPKAVVAVLAMGALVAILLVLAGTFTDKVEPAETAARAPFEIGPNQAALLTAWSTDPIVERFPGTVQATRDAIVSPRITAQVLAIECRPGDSVQAGDVLVRLDARDLALQDSEAQDALAAAEASARDAETALRRLKTIGESRTGAISERELEVAEARVKTTTAEVEGARSRVEGAKVALGFALLEAPFDGIVADKFLETGDTATVGMPIVRLYDPRQMRLETFVRESLAVTLEPGSEVRVELSSLNRTVVGLVEEIVPLAEPGSRSLLVKVGLSSNDRLYPGIFGRLLLPSGERQSIRIPAGAVETLGQLRYVTLTDGGRRMVTIGEEADGTVEIRSGLTAGESIVAPAP